MHRSQTPWNTAFWGRREGGAFHTLGGRKVTQSVSRSPFQYSLRDISVTRYSGPRRFHLFSSILITGLPTTIERSEVIGTASGSRWRPQLVRFLEKLVSWLVNFEKIFPYFSFFSSSKQFSILDTTIFDFVSFHHSVYISMTRRSRESVEFLKSFCEDVEKKKKKNSGYSNVRRELNFTFEL